MFIPFLSHVPSGSSSCSCLFFWISNFSFSSFLFRLKTIWKPQHHHLNISASVLAFAFTLQKVYFCLVKLISNLHLNILSCALLFNINILYCASLLNISITLAQLRLYLNYRLMCFYFVHLKALNWCSRTHSDLKKIVALKFFENFLAKHPCWSLF